MTRMRINLQGTDFTNLDECVELADKLARRGKPMWVVRYPERDTFTIVHAHATHLPDYVGVVYTTEHLIVHRTRNERNR